MTVGLAVRRADFVLAVLAASDGVEHTPVQVQKLLFLLDERVGNRVGGPFFNFEPFDYGPFDREVYSELERLQTVGLVEIERDVNTDWKTYRVTGPGLDQGRAYLNALPLNVSEYIRQLSKWVRGLSFADLVSAIYQAYPAMKANSVFRY